MKTPLRWTIGELEADAAIAMDRFREERLLEPLEQYLEEFDDVRARIEDLLETTLDLAGLRERALEVVSDKRLFEAVRYVAGPPISTDDLKVLSGARLTKASLKADPDEASRVVDVVLEGLDRYRFPWLGEGRMPTEQEKELAALASGAMIAARRVMTKRANQAKNAQERAVADRLAEAGLKAVKKRNISTLDMAPGRGEYCPEECKVGSRKADLVVGLLDGRCMPIECKVSNSSLNSIKRLNNDAAAKAEVWLRDYGQRQIVPAAVISGVYDIRFLLEAQERGLALFWAHNLEPLAEFVMSTEGRGG